MQKAIASLVLLFAPTIAQPQYDATPPNGVRLQRHQLAVACERGRFYLDGKLTQYPLAQPLGRNILKRCQERNRENPMSPSSVWSTSYKLHSTLVFATKR